MDNGRIVDPKLQGFAAATSDTAMLGILNAVLLGSAVNGRGPLRAIHHRILKHAVGKRCVIAFELDDGRSPMNRVIGKLHRGMRGAGMYERFLALHRLAHRHAVPLGMAQPLAFIEPLGMVLQTVVPGVSLSSLPAGDGRRAALMRTAENLALLHSLPPEVGEPRSIADFVAKQCRPGPEALAAEVPEWTPRLARMLRVLADGPRGDVGRSIVHGDLGLSQIFDDGVRAHFVDFDGVCISYPALDVGNVIVSMRLHGLSPADVEAFVGHYASRVPAETLRHLPTFIGMSYFRRAMIAFRTRQESGWRDRVSELLDRALEESHG